jgi:hypothetical protein
MYTNDKLETAPVRRRIIQQPLRAEAPFALIAVDGAQTAELEARLKRDRPLITFPSISHFLAEPARREPWEAVVIARAGAWDPRFDNQVRRRRAIALFGLAEEVYSWPEAVARLGDLTELSTWLDALNAPEPVQVKRAVKRERRAQAKAALSELSAIWSKQNARPAEARGASSEEAEAAPASATSVKEASIPASAAPAKAKTKERTRPVQLELAASLACESDVALARQSARVEPKPPSSAARKSKSQRPEPPELAPARTSPRQRVDESQKRAALHVHDGAPTDRAAERELMRLAAELGLVRAGELLDELSKRATRLALAMTRDLSPVR